MRFGDLAYRELDEVLGLTDLGGAAVSDPRRGKNTRHLLTGLLRQSVFGRLAGFEDVNDAERLSRDPAMRAIVDRKDLDRRAASTSQMARFETEWLATEENLAVLTNLSGILIDRVHDRKPPKLIVLDMDSSESPTYGEQEGSAYNGRGHGGAVHQGRKERHQLDPAFVPQLPEQPGPSSAARLGVQPGQFSAHARRARGGGTLVAHHLAREADQDRCEVG